MLGFGDMRTRPSLTLALLPALFAILLSSSPARAQDGESVTPPPETPAAAPAPDSPRASLQRYLELCRDGRDAEAAGYLDLGDADRAQGATLARHLKAVLDRHLWFDLARISGESTGELGDRLPRDTEEVGTVPGPGGKPEPVRLVMRTVDGAPRWIFSRRTVGRVEVWYAALGESWVLERLPPPLRRPGPFDVLWWQWIALPLALVLAWILGRILSSITRAVLGRIAARTDAEWDEVLVKRVSGPLTLGWGMGAAELLVRALGLYEPAELFATRLLHAGLLLALFWALWRSVDVVRDLMESSSWARERSASRSLVPLGARTAKAVVLCIGLVAVVSQLGYPVASLIAGLGVGGLAVALAAQKTVENLFGAYSLGVDQPLREGDFVRVGDVLGTVEAIGLRSTRIRTLDRTLISVPNGKLADMSIETFAARDRIRLACTIGLVYDTNHAQMQTIIAGFEKTLRDHPRIWPDTVVVRFGNFGASSLDVEVMAWFETTDFNEFRDFRQQVLLEFMRVVEEAGSSFAFPTQTVHLARSEPHSAVS